jgi:hypothetical protein
MTLGIIDTQRKRHSAKCHSAEQYWVSLCWVSLCWMLLFWMSLCWLSLPRKRSARDKYSSLLQKFVNYSIKKFYNIGPQVPPPLKLAVKRQEKFPMAENYLNWFSITALSTSLWTITMRELASSGRPTGPWSKVPGFKSSQRWHQVKTYQPML